MTALLEADTIPLKQYLDAINKNKIPKKPPEGLVDYWAFDIPSATSVIAQFETRRAITRYGCCTVIDKVWTGELAKWIGKRSVLEVMGGHGWIAEALHQHGVDIITTDNYSWDEDGSHMDSLGWPCIPLNLEARVAVQEIPADILLVSWPPLGEDEIIYVCDAWGSKKPIIYIGEIGGCNAVEGFFKRLDLSQKQPKVPLKQWYGIHDQVFVGRWRM